MTDQLQWNHFYSRGHTGGDQPGLDASNRAWDAFNAGREQRSMDRLVEMWSRPPEPQPWFQNQD